ncbi:MAG: iron ABC transporter permease [Gammaproteobacteria bacterium]|nr:iron ABC transporter permease [Gammaproteobacteria bacterium]
MTERGRHEPPYHWLLIALVLLVLMLAVGSLLAGHVSLQLSAVWMDLFQDDPSTAHLILWEVRLPRTILAVAVGASLGLAGATLQGLLRNPLASPDIVGVSGTAALGAVMMMYFGASQIFVFALPVGGMVGAFLAVTLIFLLAGRQSSNLTLILAGIAVNAFAAALTALALNFAPSPYAALEIVFWLLGSLADRSMDHVSLVLPLTFAGWVLLLSTARPLDALTLGEETASSMGFSLASLRWRMIAGVACCIGAGVSVTGSIGFVGLVVPHLLRPLVGHEPGKLLAVSALGGAALLLAADIAVRIVPTQAELKLGVVTALVGGPFFLYLILKLRSEFAS